MVAVIRCCVLSVVGDCCCLLLMLFVVVGCFRCFCLPSMMCVVVAAVRERCRCVLLCVVDVYVSCCSLPVVADVCCCRCLLYVQFVSRVFYRVLLWLLAGFVICSCLTENVIVVVRR